MTKRKKTKIAMNELFILKGFRSKVKKCFTFEVVITEKQ